MKDLLNDLSKLNKSCQKARRQNSWELKTRVCNVIQLYSEVIRLSFFSQTKEEIFCSTVLSHFRFVSEFNGFVQYLNLVAFSYALIITCCSLLVFVAQMVEYQF